MNLLNETSDVKTKVNGKEEAEYLKKLLLLASLEITKKNKILVEINKRLKSTENEFDKRAVTALIQAELVSQDNLTSIEMIRVNNDFFERLEKNFPRLGELEKQLCGYCLINLTSKDISIIRGVQQKTIEMARYRLRKRLKIPKDISIGKFLQNLE